MRLRAVLGGLFVVLAVALWHRAVVVRSAAEEAQDFGCRAGDALSFCGAVAGLSTALRNPLLHMERAHILPSAETPGQSILRSRKPASTRRSANPVSPAQPGHPTLSPVC